MESKNGSKRAIIIVAIILMSLAIIVSVVICAVLPAESKGKVSILTTPVDVDKEIDLAPPEAAAASEGDLNLSETGGSDTNQITNFTTNKSTYNKYEDVIVTVNATGPKGADANDDNYILAYVYAMYTTDSDLANQAIALKHISGNDWLLEGICGKCYLVGGWRRSTYAISWDISIGRF